MAQQLNPAWQRKSLSSDHLAASSAPILGDGPNSTQLSDRRQVISFLLDSQAQRWIPQALCQVLEAQGHNVELHVEGNASGAPAEAATAHVTTASRVALLATTSAEDPLRKPQTECLVMLVPASLDGVVTAYRRIKNLTDARAPEIGVVVVGARDQHAAWRHFRKLAVGTLRFLDIPLLNLGFLPEEVLLESGPPGHHQANFLSRIAERLARHALPGARGTESAIEPRA